MPMVVATHETSSTSTYAAVTPNTRESVASIAIQKQWNTGTSSMGFQKWKDQNYGLVSFGPDTAPRIIGLFFRM